MAHKPIGMSKEEAYEEWLGRLEETEMLPDEIEMFTQTLLAELSGYDPDQQVRMIEGLWSAKKEHPDYAAHGIRSVVIRYPWGSEIRYGIQGMAGLWGWKSVQTLREGEEW